MFNYDGVRSSQYTAPRQILANVEFQYSVGCVVAQAVGTNVTANGITRKIAKAGTPITISLANLQTPVTHGNSGNNAGNGGSEDNDNVHSTQSPQGN